MWKWSEGAYKQNRQLSFLVKRDIKMCECESEGAPKKVIPVHKIHITNNTDEKERVEC